MKRAGPTFVPALAALGVGGLMLFLSEVLWLQLPGAVLLLVGVALAVAGDRDPRVPRARPRRGAD